MAAPEVTILLNERQLYELDWLEDCYKKVRFPNPKCEEFLVEINNTLSHKIRGELDNKYKQQALFSLLGEDYVRIHFPHHKYDLKLLEQTKPDVKKAYIDEMKQLVQEQLGVTLKVAQFLTFFFFSNFFFQFCPFFSGMWVSRRC